MVEDRGCRGEKKRRKEKNYRKERREKFSFSGFLYGVNNLLRSLSGIRLELKTEERKERTNGLWKSS